MRRRLLAACPWSGSRVPSTDRSTACRAPCAPGTARSPAPAAAAAAGPAAPAASRHPGGCWARWTPPAPRACAPPAIPCQRSTARYRSHRAPPGRCRPRPGPAHRGGRMAFRSSCGCCVPEVAGGVPFSGRLCGNRRGQRRSSGQGTAVASAPAGHGIPLRATHPRSPPGRPCLLAGTPGRAGSTAAETPAAPPWRPRPWHPCHHGDRDAAAARGPAQAQQRPGGRAAGRKCSQTGSGGTSCGDGRHGGGGGAAERAAAAAGGGGEDRAAKPPAQRVTSRGGATGPGRVARGQPRQQVGRPSRSAQSSARPRRSTLPVVPQVAPAEESVRAEEPLPARQEEPQPQPAPRHCEDKAGGWWCRYSGALLRPQPARFPETRLCRMQKAPFHLSVQTGPCILFHEQREGLGESGAPTAQLRVCHQ